MTIEDNMSFLEFLKELPLLENMIFPRCFTPSNDFVLTELACFGDASNIAFGCACYLISVNKNTGERYSTLAFAKNRVKPLGKGSLALDNPLMTICRLELISSVVTCLAAKFIKTALVDGQKLVTRPTKLPSCINFLLRKIKENHFEWNPYKIHFIKGP